MEVRFWAQTDVGRQREHNEDNFLVDNQLNLFIVADGMGGHAAGEVASAAAVHEVRKYLQERQGQIAAYATDPRTEPSIRINTLLENAVRHACAKVHQLAQENPARRGMGTTIDVFLLAGGRGFIAHVGDSRVYMLRQEKIHQMTVDHSLVNELIRRGRLKPGQAFESPFKNAVTRAVGVYPSVDVDTMDFDVLPGDRFMLCSDGLAGYLDASPETLKSLLSRTDLQDAVRSLIEFANRSGGKDNITSVAVEVLPESEEMANRLAAELRMKLEALKAIPLIRYLTYRELVKLLSITETGEHAPGEAILQEGTPGEALYVLIDGRVRVFKGGTPIADLESGSHFGEMALVDSAPRSATIRAIDRSKTLAIPRDKFFDLLRGDPQLAVKLLWAFVQVLTVRLRLSSSELAERMTEQELVEQMTPLFEEPGRTHSTRVAEVPSLIDRVNHLATLPQTALPLTTTHSLPQPTLTELQRLLVPTADPVQADSATSPGKPPAAPELLHEEVTAVGPYPGPIPEPPAPRPIVRPPVPEDDDDEDDLDTSPGRQSPIPPEDEVATDAHPHGR